MSYVIKGNKVIATTGKRFKSGRCLVSSRISCVLTEGKETISLVDPEFALLSNAKKWEVEAKACRQLAKEVADNKLTQLLITGLSVDGA